MAQVDDEVALEERISEVAARAPSGRVAREPLRRVRWGQPPVASPTDYGLNRGVALRYLGGIRKIEVPGPE